MSREKLESMKGSELIKYADKLGVKVNCNKERTVLKESKSKVIDRIISVIPKDRNPIRKKVDRSAYIKALNEYINATFDNIWCDSVKCHKLKIGKKTIAEVYCRQKHIEVRVKCLTDNVDTEIIYRSGYKYYLPVHCFISYESDYIKLINNILNQQEG